MRIEILAKIASSESDFRRGNNTSQTLGHDSLVHTNYFEGAKLR